MKFDLWFPKPMTGDVEKDKHAETAMVSGKSAYIWLTEPFDDGSGQHSLVRSNGRILLCNEAVSAEECCRQIDLVISDLVKLKTKAHKEFAK
jgi:hypothetical protein